MKLTADLSLLSLITGASLIVQLVLALLLFLSMWSWWQIFQKMFVLNRAMKETNAFEDEFWNGADLNALFNRASQKQRATGALERVFEAGFREFAKHKRQASTTADAIMDSSRRAMRAAYQRELDALEANLSGLATVGSVSPYIGLLGTVWGIMNAFRGLVECRPGDAGARRAGHRGSVDRHRDRPVRRDSGGRRVQPLHPRRRPPGHALRDIHRGVLEHPAAPGLSPIRALTCAAPANRSTRSTSFRTST